MTALLHAVAVAVAVDADGPLAGALLLGESGTGKSSLALSMIEGCPFRRSALVADDQVMIESAGGWMTARAPASIRGLIEVRGHGPLSVRSVAEAPLFAAFELAAEVERVPTPTEFPAAGERAIPLYPFLWKGAEATAAHRLRRIIAALLGGQTPRAIVDGSR